MNIKGTVIVGALLGLWAWHQRERQNPDFFEDKTGTHPIRMEYGLGDRYDPSLAGEAPARALLGPTPSTRELERAAQRLESKWIKAGEQALRLEEEVATLSEELALAEETDRKNQIIYPPKRHPANGLSRRALRAIVDEWNRTASGVTPHISPYQDDWWEVIDPKQWREYREPGVLPPLAHIAEPKPTAPAIRRELRDAEKELKATDQEYRRLADLMDRVDQGDFAALQEVNRRRRRTRKARRNPIRTFRRSKRRFPSARAAWHDVHQRSRVAASRVVGITHTPTQWVFQAH